MDRPWQFAGVRTNADLEIIGEPLTLYARPTPDRLPHPAAIRVTGITPQLAAEQGLPGLPYGGACVTPTVGSGKTAIVAGICWMSPEPSERCALEGSSGR